MASGAGYLFGAALKTAIAILALYLPREFRGRVIERFRTEFATLRAVFEGSGEEITQAVRIIEGHVVVIRAMDAEPIEDEARYNIQLRISPRRGVQEMMREIAALPGASQLTGTSASIL